MSTTALFTEGKLNYTEAMNRVGYWINYAKTGAYHDVERATTALEILHRLLTTRELYFQKEGF